MEKILEQICQAVRQAGQIVLEADRTPQMVDEKEGRANFVTVYDKKVQEFLQEELGKILPEAVFVGEEEDIHASISKGFAFIVDPIDGTTNFIKDYHLSAISVGLAKDGLPYMGVIYNPYLDEMYWAWKGHGAFLNGKPIHVSSNDLAHGLVLFGTSPYYPELTDKTFAIARGLFEKSLDLRRSGSAAADLCSIAAGRAELYFEMKLSPWDYAAGTVIVAEAGGSVTQFDGSPITLGRPCQVLAVSSRTIREQAGDVFGGHAGSEEGPCV